MKHRQHLVILTVWPLVVVAFSFAIHAHAIVTDLLILGVPSLLLAFWAPRYVLKAAIFGIVFVPLWIFVEHIMDSTGQWYAVSAFPTRFLGTVAYDAPLWNFLVQFYIIMFWEHFLEHEQRIRIWQRRMTRLSITLLCFFTAAAIIWIFTPQLLQIPYFYFWLMVTVFIIPVALELHAHPQLAPKFLKIAGYFAYVFLLYEVTAVALGQWYFPSTKFIGWVELFGQRFPFEEFIAWILIGSVTCVSWYEHFDDDDR